MGAKPRLVLLDAGAVIHAHRCGGWASLCAHYDVIVPAIVVEEAAFYQDESTRERIRIDLAEDFDSGRISRYEASAKDVAATAAKLPPQLRGRVHDGEREALTYLRICGTKETAFLSADGGAIEATVVLGFSDVAMSLQAALERCGVTKKLPYEHTEAFIAEAKRRGGATLVQFGAPPGARTGRLER